MTRKIALAVAVFVLASGVSAAGAGELVVNGDFETGAFSSAWVHGAYRGNNNSPDLADHVIVLDLPYSGQYSALLGFKYTRPRSDAHAYMYQEVTIPNDISRAALNFKIRMQGYDSDFYDPFVADIRDTGNNILANIITFAFSEWNDRFKDSGWISDDGVGSEGYDVTGYAGRTIRLYFDQANLYDNQYETWTYVDQVSLVYWKFVDLAVDGNGNDVFGGVGTGLGGMSAKSGVAGDTLRYDLAVENEGLDADAYRLTANAPAGWTVLLDDGSGLRSLPFVTPSLAPGEVRNYAVALVVPVTAAGATYDVVVDAASTTRPNRYDSVTLRAHVVGAVYGADLVVDSNGYGVIGDGGAGGFALRQAPWDSTVTFAVELFNTGNAAATYAVSFSSATGAVPAMWYGGVRYTAPFNTLAIPDGGSVTMTLEVHVPAPEPGGDYATIVGAAAVPDTLKRDAVRAVLRLRAPRVDAIIATSGDGIYDRTFSGQGGASSSAGERSAVVHFPLIVQNESSQPDTFTLNWVAPDGRWRAVVQVDGVDYALPMTTPGFQASSQENFVLKVRVPTNAAYGTYSSILNFVSRRDARVSESVTATISVSSPSEVDVTIDGDGDAVYGPVGSGLGGSSVHTVVPGDTTTFQVVIENLSGTDAFDVDWNTPGGWEVTFDGRAAPVNGIAAGTYALRVVVPSWSDGGTFDVIVDVRKSDKPFFMDSVTGRVVVAPPAVVDGVIDGNGAGVFGNPGTGQGGISSQTTSAPASLNFTVELRNLGSSPDSYRITWNNYPSWGAVMDGSPAPLITAPITAGGADVFTFTVTAPAGALAGTYVHIIEVVSMSDSTSRESLAATVVIVGQPRVDLVIDGNGLGIFGPLGSGQGGRSVRASDAGAVFTASLRVRNAGSFPDSFRVDWKAPQSWPAGSVAIDDGAVVHTAPFWTGTVPAGGFVDYTAIVSVPPGLVTAGDVTLFESWSSLPPGLPESVALVTQTTAVVQGTVFDDRNHDLVWSGGDLPMAGVLVTTVPAGIEALTSGSGRFVLNVPAGTSVVVAEVNPSGFISLSPDTLGPFVLEAGDTVETGFADVPPLSISAGGARPGLSGSYVDFPHTIQAGTAGHVDLAAANEAGAVAMFMLDADGNGIFDGADRALEPADTDLDPSAGRGVVSVLLRVFVPLTLQPGVTFRVVTTAVQAISGTPVTSRDTATDAVVVVGSAVGRLLLSKQADSGAAAPGEIITYSITYFNAGTDTLQNLVVIDPVSPWVDLEAGTFGPGQDVRWTPAAGTTVYLTYDPVDADECVYSDPERLVRWILSRSQPFYVAPGESGTITYRARVR